jgi:hypothetical protein
LQNGIPYAKMGEKIEVKNGKGIAPHDLSGLKEFQKDYPGHAHLDLSRQRENQTR